MRTLIFGLVCLCCGQVFAQEQSTGTPVSPAGSIAKLARPDTYREGARELKQNGAGALKELLKVAKDKSASKEQRVGAILLMGEIAGQDKISGERDISNEDIAIFYEKTLASDPDESMRQAAAIGIVNMGNKNSVPKLKKALEDKNPKVRARAAWALAKFGDSSGRGVALKTIDDKSPGAQAVAVEAMEELGDKTLIPELERKYNTGPLLTRVNAKLAVKCIEARSLEREAKINYYAESLKDGQVEISQWAGMKLAEEVENNGVNKAQAVKALEDSASNGKNNHHAAQILNYLRAQGKVAGKTDSK